MQAVFSHRRRKILENSDRNYDRKRTTRLSMFKLVPRFLILHSCVNFLSNYSNLSKRWSRVEISFHELFQYCVYLIRWVLFNERKFKFLKNLLKISSQETEENKLKRLNFVYDWDYERRVIDYLSYINILWKYPLNGGKYKWW